MVKRIKLENDLFVFVRCRDYAEMFLGKLKKIGLICDIIILDKFVSPSQVCVHLTNHPAPVLIISGIVSGY